MRRAKVKQREDTGGLDGGGGGWVRGGEGLSYAMLQRREGGKQLWTHKYLNVSLGAVWSGGGEGD